MAADAQGEVTKLLAEVHEGSQEAGEKLFEVVYEELHGVASALMRRERQDHTLQPTALVHEAYLKLFARRELKPTNRAYFFAAAANAMRQVLVDHARKHNAEIHGGKLLRAPFDVVLSWLERTQQVGILDLDDALSTLASVQEKNSCHSGETSSMSRIPRMPAAKFGAPGLAIRRSITDSSLRSATMAASSVSSKLRSVCTQGTSWPTNNSLTQRSCRRSVLYQMT